MDGIEYSKRRKPMKIKIDVDVEKKAITGVEVPKGINSVEMALIFNQLAIRTLMGVKLEPMSNIIKPKMKIFNGAQKAV